MNIEHVQKWSAAGKRIAEGFADQLNDKANNCDYSKYFYALYLFDGDNGTGPVPLPVLKYSIRQLTRRKGSVSNLALKELLGQFLATSSVMFDNEVSRHEAVQLLQSKSLQPTAVEVLGEKVGAHFDADRYEEQLKDRFKGSRLDMSWVQRLNWNVAALGEWFGENAFDSIGVGIGFTVSGLFVLGIVIGVIQTFINDSWWAGILLAILGAFIGYYGALILFYISFVVAGVVSKILRVICFNLYTLLLTIIGVTTWIVLS